MCILKEDLSTHAQEYEMPQAASRLKQEVLNGYGSQGLLMTPNRNGWNHCLKESGDYTTMRSVQTRQQMPLFYCSLLLLSTLKQKLLIDVWISKHRFSLSSIASILISSAYFLFHMVCFYFMYDDVQALVGDTATLSVPVHIVFSSKDTEAPSVDQVPPSPGILPGRGVGAWC